MSVPPKSRPSFSPASRWGIGLDMTLRTLLVIAVVGMTNYLATQLFHRFHWSAQTQAALSSRTLSVVHSVTNHVDVTLYYDRNADYYPDILALLNEYRAANKNISVRTVDYLRDAGAAEIVKEKYEQHFLSASDTNLVIFDGGGYVRVLSGDKLTTYQAKLTGSHTKADNPQQRELEFERRPVAFNGEQAFTSILMSLVNPQPLRAYFLQGHGEVSLTDARQQGYIKFVQALQQDLIDVRPLNWVGATGIPPDCNLLIIAAPNRAFEEPELQQIAQYLHEGGRLLAMFGYNSQGHPTGLESILQTWGVGVMDDIVQDFNYSTTTQGYDIIIDQFGRHPIVDALSQLQLQVYLPRPVLKLPPGQTANAPEVDELFATSPNATLMANRSEAPHQYPLACAVEQKPVTGVSTPRGNTRIVIVGDGTFLGNLMIDSGGNRDFLNAAANWLCDRPLLLAGIGPRPVTNFRLHITEHQQQQLNWLLLAGLPGAILVFGWLVWLVRRK